MIEKERIEAIKQGVDLVALVKAKGIHLKRNGKSYLGLCPFHDDTDPSLSVNPSTNLWQCFGCKAGGDVIRFVEMFDKVDFPQAVEKLAEDGLQSSRRTGPQAQSRQGGTQTFKIQLSIVNSGLPGLGRSKPVFNFNIDFHVNNIP